MPIVLSSDSDEEPPEKKPLKQAPVKRKRPPSTSTLPIHPKKKKIASKTEPYFQCKISNFLTNHYSGVRV